MRIWVPTVKYIPHTSILISVKKWYWRKGKGLWVEYNSGEKVRSEYPTLPEFLLALKEGREHAVEIPIVRSVTVDQLLSALKEAHNALKCARQQLAGSKPLGGVHAPSLRADLMIVDQAIANSHQFIKDNA